MKMIIESLLMSIVWLIDWLIDWLLYQDLQAVDHDKVYYSTFRKDFYVEVPELAKMTPEGMFSTLFIILKLINNSSSPWFGYVFLITIKLCQL